MREQLVGRGRARAVDVGELDDEIVDRFDARGGFACTAGHPSAACSRRLPRAAARPGVRQLEQELLHVPGAGRAALGAQAAVQADVLVLDHHAAGLQPARTRTGLRQVAAPARVSRVRSSASSPLRGEGDAVRRADVDAGVALDALAASVNTVCTSQFRQRCASFNAVCGVEAELDLDLDVAQRLVDVAPRHLVAQVAARCRCRSSTRGCPSSATSA